MRGRFGVEIPASPQVPHFKLYVALIALGFVALVLRLWYLQVALGNQLLAQSESNRKRFIRLFAPRGMIVDRAGRTLAMNRPEFVVSVVPAEVGNDDSALYRLSQILEMPFEDVLHVVGSSKQRAQRLYPVPLATGVSLQVVTRIEENRLWLPGISVSPQPVRWSPEGKLASHLLGMLGEVDAKELQTLREAGISPGEYVGKMGVERAQEVWLHGKAGGKWVEVDARGRQRREIEGVPAEQGATVMLTIDKQLQRAAEEAFGNRVGAAVALDPRTGEVLLLASFPRFDPNAFARGVKSSVWREIANNPLHPLQNRAIGSKYPPGSTFKIVTAAAGLHCGAITPYTSFYCPGALQLGRWRFGCHRRHNATGFVKAIGASCDVYFYQTGLRANIDTLVEMAHAFGLGEPTGIDLAGESKGNIPTPEWKRKRYKEGWYDGDTVNASIGQGFVQTTPLQMALVAAAVANRGTIMKPYVVKRIIPPNGAPIETQPTVLKQVSLAPEHWQWIAEGMRAAVAGPGGTAHAANLPGIAVAGKTGTAEDPPRPKPHAWFICYAPMDNPRIALAVVVEQGGHGGAVAAPIARHILETFFGIQHARARGDASATD
ncbi:MAG: penicillin-binding protein 2 [Armatimonadota bacterium]|nr:penicillin-binding protein 2 [Armatimonadota bacterium]